MSNKLKFRYKFKKIIVNYKLRSSNPPITEINNIQYIQYEKN